MSIPATVEQLLRTNDVEYGVLDIQPSDGARATCAVESLIVQCSKGKIQVIYPADCMVDINALGQQVGERVEIVGKGDVIHLCKNRGFEALPSIPKALGLPAMVDKRLMEMPELTIATGDEASVISLAGAAYQKLLEDANIGDFSQPLTSLERGNLEDVDDVEQITHAVANFTQLRMKGRLEETLEFPPLPDTAQRIIKLRVDPYADIKDLTDIVETDPSLAAQVVSWAASPYYAAPGKIKSVHDAIVRVLGFDLVLNLSLGLALGKTLNLPKQSVAGFTPYWQQAVYGATTVEGLVSAIPVEERPTMGMAYLAGLLHNFGYLVLAEVFPPHFESYCRFQEANPHTSHAAIERHLLGISRDQLAAWLMRMWNMPEEVCIGLRFQNAPDYDGPESTYANLIYVGMRLLRRHGIGDAPLEAIPNSVYERLHLDPDKAREVVEGVVQAGDELKAIASNLAA